ncbi:hypothetical protein O1611_g8033 [Lasiodiplodia mahajangana]|uniref:Uncharacterized protein n=1 Tax=Lasiodiplodia mahajangana TaxID=1108764 RepID=A0ACC2JDU4_9PEZI|nr:hypothetical protein O1611_g8033 [Lasiodiplodia mahajangana]
MPGVDSTEHDIKADIPDDSVLRQYPSPVAEVHAIQDTASFYNSDSAGHEQHSIEQPAQPHGHQNEHHHGQGPASPHLEAGNENVANITSAEELRIAAQLSQDLSLGHSITSILGGPDHHSNPNDEPNLRNGIAQHESHNPHLQPNHDGRQQLQEEQHNHQQQQDHQLTQALDNHNDQHISHAEQRVPTSEPSIHRDQEPLQQSHEQSSQSPFLSDEQQSLEPHRQYLPDQQIHQQPPQPLSQQSQPSQQQRLLQPHGALDPLGQQYATHAHQTTQDNVPPRKRSKVSRACDECRRKKVKCDATSETGEEPCSNCRRSSIRCLFSRIPQKRGPSKGYIKELADRIHHIEGKLASEGNLDALSELLGGGRRESSDIFSPSAEHDENGRKRPYSSISGADFGTPNPSRQGAWNSDPRPIQSYQTPINGPKGTPYSANGLAPQPLPRPDADTPSRTGASLEDMPIDLNPSVTSKELINDAFGVYLSVVHPCFPFLAGTKERVEAQLSQCPSLLQDAFIEAFYGTMQSCVSAPGLYTTGDIGSATRIVAEWESDPSSHRNPLTNLIHLQTLILMAIATDNYGPPSLKGEHGGPSKASILGRAVGLAYSMRLHMASLDTGSHVSDSDESIAICTWWTLVMLDRWNAVSTASPLFIPNDSVVILPGLVSVLGENVYHLTRLSNILGHFAPVSLAPPKALSPEAGAVPILNSFFNLAIELFQLARLDKTREEAIPFLKSLLEHNLAPSTWDGIIRDRITERLRPSTAQSTADQTLQHLAELATASGADAVARPEGGTEPVGVRTSLTYAHLGFDPRPILHMGYLNVLARASSASDPLG